jgi:hypothetical protein
MRMVFGLIRSVVLLALGVGCGRTDNVIGVIGGDLGGPGGRPGGGNEATAGEAGGFK